MQTNVIPCEGLPVSFSFSETIHESDTFFKTNTTRIIDHAASAFPSPFTIDKERPAPDSIASRASRSVWTGERRGAAACIIPTHMVSFLPVDLADLARKASGERRRAPSFPCLQEIVSLHHQVPEFSTPVSNRKGMAPPRRFPSGERRAAIPEILRRSSRGSVFPPFRPGPGTGRLRLQELNVWFDFAPCPLKRN